MLATGTAACRLRVITAKSGMLTGHGLQGISLQVILCLLPVLLGEKQAPTVNVCDETTAANWMIYCSGRILEAVNIKSLYNDSKTFVDMPLKEAPNVVLDNFNKQFGNKSAVDVDAEELRKFVDKYFSEPGSELEPFSPVDWQEKPKKLLTIVDPKLRKWALQLHSIWKELCRKIHGGIEDHTDRYSLIWVPNEFIVPGGRFREFYYWDAYWIVKGLLASEMYTTVQRMIENLAHVVNTYGFIPNGGRIYYLQRSQPPLFSAMVYEYYECTKNESFISQMLPTMEKEQDFWNNNRMTNVTVDGANYSVYQYRTAANVPRPESYREDVISASNLPEADRPQLWTNLASAAESGWDFSTRWFKDKMTLPTIETTNVLPVDLNSFQCWNMGILEYLYERVGNTTRSKFYREKRADFRETVHQVFYNGTSGSWYDRNKRTGMHNTNFYPSIAVPLFAGCYHALDGSKAAAVYKVMQDSGVFNFPGGIPTSMIKGSNEQWDFPNGFSGLNHMIIEGLRKSENPQMQDQAFNLAQKWVLGNYKVFQETKHMWEKYNVIGDIAKPGSGGEYDVQDGFGWTNGVILDLLMTYNDRLRVPLAEQEVLPTTTSGSAFFTSFVLSSLSLLLLFRS